MKNTHEGNANVLLTLSMKLFLTSDSPTVSLKCKVKSKSSKFGGNLI